MTILNVSILRVCGRPLCGGLLLLGLAVSVPAQQVVRVREWQPGSLRGLDDLPRGRFRTQLEQLPGAAQARAIRWLRSTHLTEADLPSLRADPRGGIFYVCEADLPPAEPAESDFVPPVAAAAVPVTPFPAGLRFHSRPGAPNVLYLNFAGENVVSTEWNTVVGRSEIPAVVFSADADLTTFSDGEQVAIKRIWQRVAEDYAPFNIDVTTEPPGTLTTRTAVALITRKTDANGDPNPYNTGGGVAYLNVFGIASYARYRPAWIYHDNLSNTESYIAEAVAHEIGHNLGLSHDGIAGGSEYYGGHGTGDISWGPLMGTGYNRNVSHWCQGEYYLASNTQDDLATLAGKLAYRADDHGDGPGTATALVLTSGTNIVSTTPENDPHNAHPANKGTLERAADVDAFSLVTGNGPIRLAVQPWVMPSGTRGGNVDILVELHDEAGNGVLTNNPASQTTALLETTLPAGVYTLHVRNTGAGDPLSATPTGYTAYGSLGQYFISGWVTAPDTPVVPPTASLQVADLLEPGQASLALAVTYSDDVAVAVATVDARDIRVTGPNGYDRTARWIALDLPTDGSPRTATYAVDPPDGAAWSPAHNGTYTVTLLEHAVEDTRGNRCDAAMLGTFSVTIAPPAGLLEVTPADDLKASGTVGGPFSPSSIVYTLTNPGGSTLDWTASNPQGWVSLSATGGTLAAGASTTVTVAFNDYTGTLGVDSYAQTVSFLNTTTGQGDTTRTVDLTVEPALDRLHFSLCSLSEPGVFQMVIWATPGTEVVLESSTNLLEWWAVSTNQVAPDGTVTFAVPTDGSTPAQGYRARQGP